jgi:hypothetical protein
MLWQCGCRGTRDSGPYIREPLPSPLIDAAVTPRPDVRSYTPAILLGQTTAAPMGLIYFERMIALGIYSSGRAERHGR